MFRRLLKYLRFGGGKYKCNVCRTSVRHFFQFSHNLEYAAKSAGFQYDFRRMETLNYDNCNCPFCLSTDRERLYLLYLSNLFKSSQEHTHRVLDFAPSRAFAKAIKKYPFVEYTSADYYKTDVDIHLDICDMKEIVDNSFDIVICSHILEHVANPNKALEEIYRILKFDGLAIIMVPLFWDVKETIENPEYKTEQLRCKYYGQSDHVRLFAKDDFVQRIQQAKFVIESLNTKFFDSREISKYAIADNSILYVGHKSL